MGSGDLECASSSGSDVDNYIDMYRSSLEELRSPNLDQKAGNLESHRQGTACSTSQQYTCSTPSMERRRNDSGVQESKKMHQSSQQIIPAIRPNSPARGTRGHPWISPFPGRTRSSQFPQTHHLSGLDGHARHPSMKQQDGLQPASGAERANQALWSEWGSRQTRGWNNGGQEKIGYRSDTTVNQSSRELTGFERAMISLENGRDFEASPKYLDSIPGPSNFGRGSEECVSLVQQQGDFPGISLGRSSQEKEVSLPSMTSRDKAPVAAQDLESSEGLTVSGSLHRRSKSSRRPEKPRREDGGGVAKAGAAGEGGQHTGPVFHPLPSLFSYPPQSLQPWLPTAGVQKDMPTVSLLNSCCLESRMVSDYTDSHQEMSLVLALPGMPISKAPTLTLEEAGNILRVVNEPLAVLKAGRLTKSASTNPKLLKPTDDTGILALWLSATSEIKVIWHSLKHPAPKGQQPVDWNTDEPADLLSLADGAPFEEVFCFMEASEELACISQDCSSDSGMSGVRLDSLDQDPSGRSFRLTRQSRHGRQRKELAEKLEAEKVKKGGRVSRETAKLQTLLRACQPEADEEESLFFWIAESSISNGKQILQEMQAQIASTPTLASKSGVPAMKLQEVHDCLAEATRIADAAKAAGDSSLEATHSFSSWFVSGPGMAAPSHLFAMGSSTKLFEQMAQAPSSRSRSTCRGNDSSRSGRSSSPSSSDCQSNAQSLMTVGDSCVLAATANFLVSDKRWNINHLSTVTVTVAMGVRSTGDIGDKTKCEEAARECAHQMAKSRAERGAQAEAERVGRRRLEELTAERIAKIPKQRLIAHVSPPTAPEAPQRHPLQENRSGTASSSRSIPAVGQDSQPSASCSTAGPDEEANHWQRNSGHLHSHPSFIPDNMYISTFEPAVHTNKDASGWQADPEPNLGLGFGSGPYALRNGKRAHYGGARPPGFTYGQWHQTRTSEAYPYSQSGAWRPGGTPSQVPSQVTCPLPSTPWSQPFKHFGLQGRPEVPPVRMPGMNTTRYPRHLPPMLPYLMLVNQGLIPNPKPFSPPVATQPALPTAPCATGTQSARPNTFRRTSLSDMWKHMGGDQLASLDRLREHNMDLMCLKSVDAFRRKSMSDIGKKQWVDMSRKSADSCRQLKFIRRQFWNNLSGTGDNEDKRQ